MRSDQEALSGLRTGEGRADEGLTEGEKQERVYQAEEKGFGLCWKRTKHRRGMLSWGVEQG